MSVVAPGLPERLYVLGIANKHTPNNHCIKILLLQQVNCPLNDRATKTKYVQSKSIQFESRTICPQNSSRKYLRRLMEFQITDRDPFLTRPKGAVSPKLFRIRMARCASTNDHWSMAFPEPKQSNPSLRYGNAISNFCPNWNDFLATHCKRYHSATELIQLRKAGLHENQRSS